MKIGIRKNLPKYISVVCCIALYITAFATSSVIYPEYSMSVLSVSSSAAFLLSFYIMTYFLATNKVFCTVFSIYFLAVIVFCVYVILISILDKYISILQNSWFPWVVAPFTIPFGIISLSFVKPIVQFLEFTLDISKNLFGKENGDFLGYTLIFIVCVLFYVVCFTTRYYKTRKLTM